MTPEASDEPVDMVFFEVRGRRYALPIWTVREITDLPPVTPVPTAGRAVRGMVPVHGHALPLVDLGPWLTPRSHDDSFGDLPARTAEQTVLVLEAPIGNEAGTTRVALAVDRVFKVATVTREQTWAPPAGPVFVTASVVDAEGPAMLLDASAALAEVAQTIRSTQWEREHGDE